MSAEGRFFHGGKTTYRARRSFQGPPATWHYNQTPEEYAAPRLDEVRTYSGNTGPVWPVGSAYPDHFFFGDPHINFYEGTAEFDDVKLYVPTP